MRSWILLVSIILTTGCTSDVPRKAAPVSVMGNVSQGGQPVGGVMIVFQPLGDGHVKELAIQKDGTFQGDLITGEYAYYLTKPAAAGTQLPASKVPPQYFAADLSRTVVVETGKTLAIALE